MGFLKQPWLKVKFVLKSLFFLQYMPLAVLYSYRRDRAERQHLPQVNAEPLTSPGKLVEAVATAQGAHFYFEQAELAVDFLTPDFARITWQPGLPPVPYAIAQDDWQPVTTHLEAQGDDWAIASDALKITVGVKGHLTFYDAAGQVVRAEQPPIRQGDRWLHQANLPEEEQIYGLGERASSLNLRARQPQQTQRTYQMWNYDPGNIYRPGVDPMYICVPVYLGLNQAGSYLIFYENSFRGEFTFGDEAIARFEGGSLRYYLAVGEPAQVIERYTHLTGRAPLPPRWALGYHQSRWGYRSEANVRQEIASFKAHDLPISAVHLDIDCQVSHRAFTIDPKRFPQLRQFIQELSGMGVRCIAINNPGIKHSRHSNLFIEGQVLDAFCTYPNGELVVAPVWAGRMVFPDFTNPEVRTWWSNQFAYLLNVGIAGFWNDMSEPAAFVAWGDPTLPQVAQHAMEGRRGDHREAHNLYGFLEARSAYDGLRQHRPQHRPFIVSRSGWAGLQRYAWTWTGDIVSTWEALRQTIATVIGLGLSGIPYSGPDIGGFLGNPSAELYVRWFQMATFFMFCRTHSSTSVEPRAPWSYGEPALSIIRRFLEVRYQLLPYFYTLAWETEQTGVPPVRPLFWDDWQNSSLWGSEDAFYLGKALLVYPVLQPGATSRSVTPPSGQWYHFWDDTLLSAGETTQLEAPLERIPVLVRAGSVLPMENGRQLTLHLYPPESGDSESLLYSDAGDGYGESRRDRFHLSRQGQQLTLTWETEGEYPFPYEEVQLQIHGMNPQQAWIDDQDVSLQGQTLSCQIFHQARFLLIPEMPT